VLYLHTYMHTYIHTYIQGTPVLLHKYTNTYIQKKHTYIPRELSIDGAKVGQTDPHRPACMYVCMYVYIYMYVCMYVCTAHSDQLDNSWSCMYVCMELSIDGAKVGHTDPH
jgi:hypothetical protein